MRRALDFLYPRPDGSEYEGWEVTNVREVLRAALAEERDFLIARLHSEECPYDSMICECDMDWYSSHVDTVITHILGSSE
jgi:hypothetical protein